ncbi:chromo domain [Trichoderma arundinaceum]|uniref:Chromo domain n=1 Tax=Trichoderma arundinaceum TaxID=490622 RepID=A0A395P075_TRIAR|nr:chromo domain [Trichoderma arundinaceum]
MPRSRRGAPKKPKTRKRPAAQDEGWYTIRRILDERTIKGRVEYLVDWDDNIVTGQAYDPTWSCEVTTTAREEWERLKARRIKEDRQQQQQLERQLEQQFEPEPEPVPVLDPEQHQGEQPNPQDQQSQQEPASDQESDSSQPPQPAHRRRLDKVGASQRKRRHSPSPTLSLSSPSPFRPRKAPRSDTCGSLCDEPAVSLVSSPSISTPSELPDLPDVDLSEYQTRPTSLVVVEIPKNSNINPADYLSVLGSQSSGKSTQSLAELENEDSRVSILRNSQGTVPDSQEITDRSWTQQHIANESSQPIARLIVSQPQDRSPESSSRTIPDSFEDPSKSTSQQSNKTTEHRQGFPQSSHKPTRISFEDRIQESPDSGGSGIPSRQPDQSRAGSPALSDSLSHNTPVPRVSQPSASSRPPISELTQSDASPIFFTQPRISLLLDHPESSVSSRILESPSHPPTEVNSTNNSSTPSALDQGTSQAAQIVPRDFESPSQHLTGSEPQESLSNPETQGCQRADAGNHNPAPTSLLQPGVVNFPSEAIKVSQAKPATPLNRFKGRRMENETPEQADARRRRTLDAELSEIFSLDGFDTGSASAPHTASQPEQHQMRLDQTSVYEPEGRPAPAERDLANTYIELPVHPSDLHHGAESPGMKGKLPSENVAAAGNEPEQGRDTTPVTTTGQQVSTPHRPVATELADIFGSDFVESGLEPPPAVPDFEQTQHSTVSLADISRQPEPAYKDIPLVSFIRPDEPLMQEPSTDPTHSEQAHSEPSPTASSASLSTAHPLPAVMKHTVTLPFQASLRQKYNDIIVEYKAPFIEFNKCFSDEDYSEPDPSLVKRIDDLFNHLLNLCDYPENIIGTDLEKLPPAQQAKYCCDANPKFNFIFELLSGVEEHSNILIVARSPDLLRLLCHLAEALAMQFSCNAIGRSSLTSGSSSSKLVLALPNEVVDSREFDVVIGYDHSFRHSSIAQGLSPDSGNNKQQLVLVLVTTHSIEHIDPQIPEDLPLIERKSVLVSAIVRAWHMVESPDRGYQEPHEIAALFIEYLAGDQDTPLWDPIPVPETILDVYVHSQSRSQIPTVHQREQESGRKRKHNESDDFDSKRPRVLSTGEMVAGVGTGVPPLSDEVRALLEYAAPKEDPSRPEVLINVPHTVLQALAEKFSEYERRLEAADCEAEYQAVISGLEKRIKEYERTTHKVYESQRAALQDRSRFETEKRKMEAAMQSAADQSEREVEKAKKRILELEATVVRLTEDPNASDPQDTPLAKTEKLLQEAQAKVTVLEKRLENAHKDADYIRNLYQDAASTASGLKSENNQLISLNEDLSKKAAENSVRVHEIQERNTVKIYLEQAEELKVQIREREIELDRAREELRQLKNGRRETRQSSVPRSPRMGMMSPRTITRAYGGPASRGASPAPGTSIEGMQFYGQQSGNGRWDHLRG